MFADFLSQSLMCLPVSQKNIALRQQAGNAPLPWLNYIFHIVGHIWVNSSTQVNKPKRLQCHLHSTKNLLGRSCFAPHAATEWVNGHHDQYLFPVVSGFRIMSILNQCFSRLPPQFFSQPSTVSVAEGEKIPTNQIKQMIFRQAIDHPSCSTGLTGRS